MSLLTLAIGSIATWRVSHAFVKELGPLGIFARLRAFAARTQKRSGGFFDLLSCVYCFSLWIGLGASLFVSHNVFQWLGYGFAFSGIAVILEAMFVDLTK